MTCDGTDDNTPDRTNPYLFDDAQALIRVECRCESLVGSDDSVTKRCGDTRDFFKSER